MLTGGFCRKVWVVLYSLARRYDGLCVLYVIVGVAADRAEALSDENCEPRNEREKRQPNHVPYPGVLHLSMSRQDFTLRKLQNSNRCIPRQILVLTGTIGDIGLLLGSS